MYQIRQTNQFSSWLSKLKDIKGKVSIFRRIDRIRKGNFGDKSTQSEDIKKAKELAKEYSNEKWINRFWYITIFRQ